MAHIKRSNSCNVLYWEIGKRIKDKTQQQIHQIRFILNQPFISNGS